MKISNYKYSPDIPEVFRCRVPLANTIQTYVVNGFLSEELSAEQFSLVRKSCAGFDLKINKESQPDQNIQIISFRNSEYLDKLEFENTINVAEGSSCKVLLCTHTLSMDSFETNEIININVEKQADAKFVLMQNEHNQSKHSILLNINLEEDSKFKLSVISLHGEALTNEFECNLNGENAYCELNGLYLVDGSQTISTKVNMRHNKPNCKSSQLFKGILDNSSKALFSGKIVVAKDSQKTEAYQANHNLLLSKSAKVYAQPQLEIYADDVKCSHGATSGRLDEMALFYMRSRGIGREEAKILQQLAFAYDVLEKISNEELRARLSDLAESRLRGEFSHCSNCSMNCC
ncbi:MAG: Fe-S cluster assembly protein SufD [Bacteroidales bacterium]